jgi:hypothetical protein
MYDLITAAIVALPLVCILAILSFRPYRVVR